MTALAAFTTLAGLSGLVVADAGSASELAWLGAATAALFLAAGMLVESPGPVHAAVALLGAIFLLRQDGRLLLAPLYGAALLLIEDLAIQTIELRGVGRLGRGAIGARTVATLVAATAGACAAALAAVAVTVAPGRSVGFTALASIVVVAAFAGVVRMARRRYRDTEFGEPPAARGGSPPP